LSAAALVVGKFYPPHPGHLHLMAEALRIRTEVVVLCLGSWCDSSPPAARFDALLLDAEAEGIDMSRVHGRSGYDEAPFDLSSEHVWASHAALFAEYLRGMTAVDVLVSSEGYGAELGARLGIAHHSFDPYRSTVPLSSTQIRSQPLQYWHRLGAGTRAMLVTRIVVVGAESTGTTTVSQELAARLRLRGGPWADTRWVGEVGREVTAAKQEQVFRRTGRRPLAVDWTPEDFREIAARQGEVEVGAASAGGPVLVCDTDAFVTPIWERRYVGRDRAVLDPAALGSGHVYLVTDHRGVAFVQDGMRDGEHIRAAMTGEIIDELISAQRPWAMLTGPLAERVDLAERIVDQTLARRLRMEPPI